jgi:TraX protein
MAEIHALPRPRDESFALIRFPHPGSLEAMKLVAFAAMVCDHVNKIVLKLQWPSLTTVGRLAFPLFAFVLAVNLLRHTRNAEGYFRRLVIWGLATQPVYLWATGRQDLNILFTLAVGLQLVLAVEALAAAPAGTLPRAALWRVALTLLASLVPDYPLTGPLFVLACHAWLARPSLDRFLLLLVTLAALNQDLQFALPALAALPVALALAALRPPLPRLAGPTLYLAYPAHFALLRLLA